MDALGENQSITLQYRIHFSVDSNVTDHAWPTFTILGRYHMRSHACESGE